MKIVLCDEHRIVREGLRAILEKAGFVVVGEAANAREVVSLARARAPDVVLMKIAMPELDGLEVTRQLRSQRPAIKVIWLCSNTDRRYAQSLLGAGASGYLPESAASEELILALNTTASGLEYVSSSLEDVSVDDRSGGRGTSQEDSAIPPSSRRFSSSIVQKALSPRERDVLRLIAEGQSSKDIAVTLDIAVTTVETHRRQLMAKLNIRTIAELTKYAIREGLTSLE
jgi:two-component system, NarL family, response regulator NreC